jgi:hypothetical protein
MPAADLPNQGLLIRQKKPKAMKPWANPPVKVEETNWSGYFTPIQAIEG